MKESQILEKAHELLDSGKGVALCSIIEKRGSTPRGEGTKILVTEEGETYGTVGGGEFERQLINEALEAIKKGESKTKTYTLSEEETGLWCGGESTVFFDVMGALPEIVLIGSGNVAKPVYDIANTLDYNVTVVDDNDETLTEERFPDAKRILDEYDQALNKVQTNENTYVVVLQGEPHRDVRGLERFIGKVPYLGVIGSDNKVRKIKEELKNKGYAEENVEKIRAPIGISINAERPQEIGVSIIGEIVKEYNS